MPTAVPTPGSCWSPERVGRFRRFGNAKCPLRGIWARSTSQPRKPRKPRHRRHDGYHAERGQHRIHASARPTQVSDKLVTATLTRPLGLNLKEDGERIVVESIEEDSNADRSGLFSPGDALVACSAIVMVAAENSNAALYDRNSRGKKGGCCSTGCPDCPFNHRNWQRVMFDCRGKSFETVIAALQSNSQARWLARGADTAITVQVEKQ
jgi:hypothetical protein